MPECYAGTYYPHLREVLDSRYAGFSDGELEEAFAEASGENITPAEYEEFFDGLGTALAKVAEPTATFAKAVGPGALRGAAAGSALGPFGALGGALVGAAGSALQQRYGGHDARGIGGVLSGAAGTAGGSPTGPGALASGLLGLAGGRGGPASAMLMALLRRPETAQALAALGEGRHLLVPVGRQQVPVPAHTFAGLLGALARETEAEWTTDAESEEEPEAGDERAGRLLGLLVGAEQDETESYDDDATAAYEEFDAYAGFDDEEGLDDAEDFDDIELDDTLTDDECFAFEFDELVGAR
ncbi:hypothetical protein ACWCXB_02255 [Streptomyces sp. NPDC001514]